MRKNEQVKVSLGPGGVKTSDQNGGKVTGGSADGRSWRLTHRPKAGATGAGADGREGAGEGGHCGRPSGSGSNKARGFVLERMCWSLERHLIWTSRPAAWVADSQRWSRGVWAVVRAGGGCGAEGEQVSTNQLARLLCLSRRYVRDHGGLRSAP